MDCPRHGDRHMQQDGPFRWCEECAWEDPNNPEEAPPPPAQERKPVEGIESIGTKDLARMCQARVQELEEGLAAAEKRFREQQAAAKAEIAKLRRIIGFCTSSSPTAAAAKRNDGTVPRDPGDSKNAWTCPDCGHRTVSRWVARHKGECPARAA